MTTAISANPPKPDAVLQELWQVKDQIAQRYGNAHNLVQALRQMQDALPASMQQQIIKRPAESAQRPRGTAQAPG
jgi:hypothetical protein